MSTDHSAGLAEAVAGNTVAAWLDAHGIATLHLLLVDASGTVRAKRAGVSAAARALESGWSFIDAIEWWTPADTLWKGFGSSSQPVNLDLSTWRPYPFGAKAAACIGEFELPLAELSPRYQLGEMVKRLERAGYHAKSAWEFECIVLEGDHGDLDPAIGANRCWRAGTMAEEADSLDELTATLAAADIALDHICAELGPGCLELATGPEAPVRSADEAALTKMFTKAHYAGRGQRATFMAQLGPQFPGLGGHPSLSLHDVADGTNITCEAPGVLSKAASAAIAGVVALLPELMAMVAPYPNSYRRIGPGNWAPATATWGIDSYSCALRVVATAAEHARLELRIPGADVSPHFGLAMMVAAACFGIEEGLEAPPPVVAPADGRNLTGAVALPRDLTEATDRLEASAIARSLFGDAFIDHFCASRRAEVAACHRFVSAAERDRYLDYV